MGTSRAHDWVRTVDGGWVRAQVPQTRGLARQHNRVLKDLFKGAATTVITQRKDVIYADYERLLTAGTKPSLAKLTLARTIAAIVLCAGRSDNDAVHRALTNGLVPGIDLGGPTDKLCPSEEPKNQSPTEAPMEAPTAAWRTR